MSQLIHLLQNNIHYINLIVNPAHWRKLKTLYTFHTWDSIDRLNTIKYQYTSQICHPTPEIIIPKAF